MARRGRGGRRMGGRRKKFGRRGAMRRLPLNRGILSGVHRFKETCELTQWSAAAGSTQFGVQTYKLNDIFNAGQFKNLFDLYKITGVKLTIIPRYNQASVAEASNGPTQNPLPMLYVAPNRSPWSTAPTSVQDILNDDGCKVMTLKNKVSFWLKSPGPQILDGAANGVPVQFNNNTRLWLTTGGNGQTVDQSGVLYYGHRWAISNLGTAGVYTDVYATYYMTFKEQD